MVDVSEAARGDQVVPGDAEAIEQLSSSLRRFALGMGDAAGVLSSLGSTGWSGDGAEAFRAVLDEQPERYGSAAEAFSAVSLALAAYAFELRAAQNQADIAINCYSDGQRSSAAWHASGADAPLAPEEDRMHPPPGARPEPVDPGNADRDAARGLVQGAQERVEKAAARLFPVLSRAAQGAPRHPSLWSRFTDGLAASVENGPGGTLKDSVEDVLIGAGKAGRDMGTGLWSMTGGAVSNPRIAGDAWLDLAKVVGGDSAARQEFVLNFVDFQDWDRHPFEAAGYTATNIGAFLLTPGKLAKASRTAPDMADLDEALRKVNPRFSKGDPAYTQNCTHCAQALPLRLRGKNAVARPLPRHLQHRQEGDLRPGGRAPRSIEQPWRLARVYAQPAAIVRALEDAGPGAVAAVLVRWRRGGGHAFNAVNIDGTVHFVDAQTGAADARPYFARAIPYRTSYVMLTRPKPSLRVSLYVEGAQPIHPVTSVARAGSLGVTTPQPSAR